jgi:hypothetical protein
VGLDVAEGDQGSEAEGGMTRQQAVDGVALMFLYDAERCGAPLDEKQAQAMAALVVDTFGDTRWFASIREILTPIVASLGEMPVGPRTRGVRVKGQRRKLTLWDLVLGARERARAEKRKAHIASVVEAKRALRAAKMALADRPEAPERQREAFRLVRIEGLTYRDVGTKLGVSAAAVFQAVKRFEEGVNKLPGSPA